MTLLRIAWFSYEDIEQCILRGSINKSQKDEKGNSVNGKKYTIFGPDCCDAPFYCVGKIVRGTGGRMC